MRPAKPLTAASISRRARTAKTLLATASSRSWLVVDMLAQAAGLLLSIARFTGERAKPLMTRLRIPKTHAYLLTRAKDPLEFTHGAADVLPVFKRFFAVNQSKPICVKGRACTCTQMIQRPRCGNWRRQDPSNFDLGVDAEPWFEDLENGLAAAPRKRGRPRKTKKGGDNVAAG